MCTFGSKPAGTWQPIWLEAIRISKGFREVLQGSPRLALKAGRASFCSGVEQRETSPWHKRSSQCEVVSLLRYPSDGIELPPLKTLLPLCVRKQVLWCFVNSIQRRL